MKSPHFLGPVCTYRYLVNGQFVEVRIDQAGEHDNWDDRTWEFFDQHGNHLNDGVVWYVDNDEVPSYEIVRTHIVDPNKDCLGGESE